MELYKTITGLFVAKTQYGEWQAKQAGFLWDATQKVWTTADANKAQALARVTGLMFAVPPTYPLAVAPKPTPLSDPWPTVGAGRYAVLDPSDRVLKFYRVQRPTTGTWKGYLFLKVMASEATYPIKDAQQKKVILDLIAKDPHAAMAKYGQEIGKCGYCGLTLTDQLSRALGIGPICRKTLLAPRTGNGSSAT